MIYGTRSSRISAEPGVEPKRAQTLARHSDPQIDHEHLRPRGRKRPGRSDWKTGIAAPLNECISRGDRPKSDQVVALPVAQNVAQPTDISCPPSSEGDAENSRNEAEEAPEIPVNPCQVKG